MSTVTNPKGKLPARVYWIRRAVVIGVPLLVLWLLISMIFGGGSDSPSTGTASQAAAKTSPSPTARPTTAATAQPTARPGSATGKSAKGGTPAAAPLAQPTGPCNAADVTVRPVIAASYAGRPTTISLRLTGSSPACTFAVSPQSLAVKITSGSDRIWSTQDCAKAVPRQSVVVRSAQATALPITWGGRRSTNGNCTVENDWAKPGYYHVSATTIGGLPTDTQFKMTLAPRVTITKTVTPKPTPTPTKGAGKAKGAGSAKVD